MIRVKLSEEELKTLKNKRLQKDICLRRLATVLGVVESTYSSYERGRQNIPKHLLIRLAEFYRASELKNFGVDVESKVSDKQGSTSLGETRRAREVLNSAETYDFSKFYKTRTIISSELNLYIPEKWMR